MRCPFVWTCARQVEPPPAGAMRAPLVELSSQPMNIDRKAGSSGPGCTEGGGKALPTASTPTAAAPSIAEMQQFARQMFTDESKMMLDTLEAPMCGASTNGTLGNVIQAINNIFDQHADAICCSPERPDLQMSKEEGVGWLVAALFRREVRVDEARPLGKRVGKQLSSIVKKEEEKIKEQTKAEKKAARKAAEKDPIQAALLDDALAQIEADSDAKRATVDARLYDLKLPKGKIVESSRPR